VHDARNSEAGILRIEVAESIVETDAIDLVLIDPIFTGIHDELGGAVVGIVEIIEKASTLEVADVRVLGTRSFAFIRKPLRILRSAGW
jgi:hypothetical protein